MVHELQIEETMKKGPVVMAPLNANNNSGYLLIEEE
jgi:hypothetical protein